jgi:hypothetical protein
MNEDSMTIDELAITAAGMRACATVYDTQPDLVSALVSTAKKIEDFCTLARQAVVEIEDAVAELSRAIDRSQLH